MASFFFRIWGPYERWLQRSPLLAKSVTTATLTCLGDIGAQTIERRLLDEKDKPFDIHRNLRLTGFGLVVIGPALHGWYGFLNRMIPSTRTPAVLAKMAIDQTVFAPAVMFSFIAGLGVLEGMSRDDIWSKFSHAFWPTMKANWTIWPAAQVLNFKFVPQQFQTLYINLVSLGWNTYLSMANAKAVRHTKLAREAAAAAAAAAAGTAGAAAVASVDKNHSGAV